MDQLSSQDPTSYSRPDHHLIKHIHLSLDVNFERKVLSGKCQLSVERIDLKKREFVLDVSFLVILNVSLISGESLDFTVGEHIDEIGSKMTITLPSDISDPCLEIVVQYETSPKASALQWLDPAQTAGKKLPYMFSQCQAIHARSVMPCQDSPAVKFTYTAQITAPEQYTVLMSAIKNETTTGKGGVGKQHAFTQNVPIPSYLLALAVGDLDFRKLGPRSTIWAEKEIIEQSAWEFADTDKMLTTAEELCGPYVWGIYDILVLPPSFAFGGMENPCLTFATPTLLAGDRSLADVIVHEITHSWTGNLVTNRNFEHFWLNEGFTVFVERKISSRLYGEPTTDTRFRDFSSILGLAELRDTISHFGENNRLTNLVVDLKGLNPDDAFSTVPYEKGSTFLRYLENLLGGPDAFEPFLRHYLSTFQKKSIETDDFKNLLLEYFKSNPAIKDIDWQGWLHTPGMPLHIPKYDTTMSEACTALAKRWVACKADFSQFNKTDLDSLNSMQKRQFMDEILASDLSLDQVKEIQDIYDLDSIKNSEVRFRWLRLCIKARWADKVEKALQFVNEQGRMKYVRPIYRDLYGWEAMRERTIRNFEENKKYMMHILLYTIKKDLKLE